MVLDYVPFDVFYLNDIFHKLNLKTEDIFKFINYRFCTYIFSKGKNEGKMCCRYSKNPIIDNCCSQHIKYFNNNNIKKNIVIKNDNKYYKKKEIIYYCGAKGIKSDKCRRIVKNPGDRCIYHLNNKTDKNIITYKKNKEYQNIENLRNINCYKILSYLGYNGTSEGSYKRYKFDDHNLIINQNNKFYDNQNNIGGYGAIDLLIKIFKYNYNKSIQFLETIKDNKKENKIFINLEKTNNNKGKNKDKHIYKDIPLFDKKNIDNVRNYLVNKRKIDKNIINNLINNNLIYSDKYSNCIFLDEKRSYAYIRGTGDIKFIITNGKPNFFKYRFGNNEDIYLFESIIDALSFRTLYNKDGIYIITNGNTLIKKIHELEEIKNSSQIYCCFDNDPKGVYFDLTIKNIFKNKKINILKSINKDFNEDLMKSKF